MCSAPCLVCVTYCTIGGSLTFLDMEDWNNYRREQRLVIGGIEKMKEKMNEYGMYNVRYEKARNGLPVL